MYSPEDLQLGDLKSNHRSCTVSTTVKKLDHYLRYPLKQMNQTQDRDSYILSNEASVLNTKRCDKPALQRNPQRCVIEQASYGVIAGVSQNGAHLLSISA